MCVCVYVWGGESGGSVGGRSGEMCVCVCARTRARAREHISHTEPFLNFYCCCLYGRKGITDSIMIRIERIFQTLFVDGTPLPCGGKDNMHTITERRKGEERERKKKGPKRTENAFYERSIFLAPQKRHSSGRFPSLFLLQDAGRPPHANS